MKQLSNADVKILILSSTADDLNKVSVLLNLFIHRTCSCTLNFLFYNVYKLFTERKRKNGNRV